MNLSQSVLVFTLLVSIAVGIPDFRNRLPNNETKDVCPNLGHDQCKVGKTTVNQFGRDFKATGLKYTKAFCAMDSDGDGVSNGAELGDPCCVWSVGATPARTTDISNPGDPASKPKASTDITCKTNPATNTSDPVCFPADATVMLQNGDVKLMQHLEIGDVVAVGGGKFSPVFMFTHRLTTGSYPMLRLDTVSSASITLSHGHFIYASGRLIRADNVVVGDTLQLADGTYSKVVRIADVSKIGLYNPQTHHGDILVNGITASTYTHVIENKIAHAALAPLRAAYNSFGFFTNSLESGIDHFTAQ